MTRYLRRQPGARPQRYSTHGNGQVPRVVNLTGTSLPRLGSNPSPTSHVDKAYFTPHAMIGLQHTRGQQWYGSFIAHGGEASHSYATPIWLIHRTSEMLLSGVRLHAIYRVWPRNVKLHNSSTSRFFIFGFRVVVLWSAAVRVVIRGRVRANPTAKIPLLPWQQLMSVACLASPKPVYSLRNHHLFFESV